MTPTTPTNPEQPTFLQRLALAFVAFFYVLTRADFAIRVGRLREEARAPVPLPPPAEPPSAARAPSVQPAAGRPAAPPSSASTAAAVPGPAAPPPPAPGAAAKPAAPSAPASPVAEAPAKPDPRPALQVLSLLQREGRLVDFVEEDLTGFTDAQIGAAARTVHAGCKRVIEANFRLEPVYREPEGATVTVAGGFDPAAIRLTGNVVGTPPFRGALRHHGWRAAEVKLPQLAEGQDGKVVAPAEVEL
jgi:hypothetical protein